jgi:hypothetical protein
LEGRLRLAVPVRTSIVSDSTLVESDPEGAQTSVVGIANDDYSETWSVLVNDRPAQLRLIESEDPGSGDGSLSAMNPSALDYELVSDSLTDGMMDLRFRTLAPVEFDKESSEASVELGLPYPLVQDITLRGDVEVTLLGDDTHDVTSSEVSMAKQLVFRNLPTQTIPLRISPKTPTQSELLTDKILVRTAINEISQHDQLIANLTGSGEFMIHLENPDQTEVQVDLNGVPAAFKVMDKQLVLRIPADTDRHIVDVRLWVDRPAGEFFQTIQPLAHVGPGSGQLIWQLTVPSDSHLVWTTSSVGRAMRWAFEKWRLVRQPLLTETELASRIGSMEWGAVELSPMPSGNRYLFSSLDDRSFRAMTFSRTALWMIVAGVILFVTALLTHVPSTRNPLTSAIAIVGFAGLLAVAPDAAILVGQIAMLAMVLVVVMLAIRSLMQPHPSRVLTNTRDRRADSSASQNARQPVDYRPPSSIAVTHSIGPEDISSATDEVAS